MPKVIWSGRPPDTRLRELMQAEGIALAGDGGAAAIAVLLTGETGTGKEVAARLLHEWDRLCIGRASASGRGKGPETAERWAHRTVGDGNEITMSSLE